MYIVTPTNFHKLLRRRPIHLLHNLRTDKPLSQKVVTKILKDNLIVLDVFFAASMEEKVDHWFALDAAKDDEQSQCY